MKKAEHMTRRELLAWRVECHGRLMKASDELERLSKESQAAAAAPASPRGRGRPPKPLKDRIDQARAERLRAGADYREACLLLEGEKPRGLRARITAEMAEFMHRSPGTVQDMRKADRRKSRVKPRG